MRLLVTAAPGGNRSASFTDAEAGLTTVKAQPHTVGPRHSRRECSSRVICVCDTSMVRFWHGRTGRSTSPRGRRPDPSAPQFGKSRITAVHIPHASSAHTVHSQTTQQPRAASTKTNPTITSRYCHHPGPRLAFTSCPTHPPTPSASSSSTPLTQLLAPRRRHRPGPLPARRPGCTRLQTEPP